MAQSIVKNNTAIRGTGRKSIFYCCLQNGRLHRDRPKVVPLATNAMKKDAVDVLPPMLVIFFFKIRHVLNSLFLFLLMESSFFLSSLFVAEKGFLPSFTHRHTENTDAALFFKLAVAQRDLPMPMSRLCESMTNTQQFTFTIDSTDTTPRTVYSRGRTYMNGIVLQQTSLILPLLDTIIYFIDDKVSSSVTLGKGSALNAINMKALTKGTAASAFPHLTVSGVMQFGAQLQIQNSDFNVFTFHQVVTKCAKVIVGSSRFSQD